MKKLFLWQFSGFVLSTAIGTLLHFLYSFTQFLPFAPFSAVNESTFEHMKILFFPTFLFAAVQAPFFHKEYNGFWGVKLIGTSAALLTMPIAFYTLTGVFGSLPAWLNVLIFFLSAAVGFYLEFRLFDNKKTPIRSSAFPLTVFVALSVAFVVCTFFPPHIPLFQDPVTGGFGII